MMKSIYRVFSGLATLVLALVVMQSCMTQTRNVPPADETETAPATAEELTKGWSINFCENVTVEDNVAIEIGRANDNGTRRVWRSVNPQNERALVLPEDLRYADAIWVKLVAENERTVEACVKFDGANAEQITTNDTEEAEVERTDKDDCGC